MGKEIRLSMAETNSLAIMFFSRFSEYLATFKKTVAMHEVFLTRLAQHPIFRNDHNFKVFLEYEQDVSKLFLIHWPMHGNRSLLISIHGSKTAGM